MDNFVKPCQHWDQKKRYSVIQGKVTPAFINNKPLINKPDPFKPAFHFLPAFNPPFKEFRSLSVILFTFKIQGLTNSHNRFYCHRHLFFQFQYLYMDQYTVFHPQNKLYCHRYFFF